MSIIFNVNTQFLQLWKWAVFGHICPKTAEMNSSNLQQQLQGVQNIMDSLSDNHVLGYLLHQNQDWPCLHYILTESEKMSAYLNYLA